MNKELLSSNTHFILMSLDMKSFLDKFKEIFQIGGGGVGEN